MIVLKSLDLEVKGSEAAGYTVSVVGPEGERAESPFDWASLARLATPLQDIQEGRADRSTLERVGMALFQALFPLNVLIVYVAVKARLKTDEGLRVRLHLPAEFAHLPWELLYYPPHYLSLDPHNPLIRFLDLPDPPSPLAARPPLRLLHLVASPVDAPPLNAKRETAQLGSALAGLTKQGKLEIVPARPGPLAALRAGLRQGCHMLHFTGHGGLTDGMGYLLFEGDGKRSELVGSDTLAQLLRGTTVRLALLNACQSAVAADSQAFGSVAAALVRAGLPAVIAHQYVLPDSSAIPFAAEFYGALADGFPVDAAVSEGRRAILSELGEAWRDRVDWATPVLFMRAPDGRILSLEGEKTDSEGQPLPPAVQQTITTGDVSGNVFNVGVMSGGTLVVGGGDAGLVAPPTAAPSPPRQRATERLLNLLTELQQLVRDRAPEARRAEATDRVAALKSAATEERPNLDAIESVLRWFETELPQLSGPVYNVLGGVEQRIKEAEEDLLPEFRRRFGEFL
jgi:hypothetical protein